MEAIGVGEFERHYSLPWQVLELETLKETYACHYFYWTWRLCKGLELAITAIGVGDFVRDLSLTWYPLELETV